MFLNLNVTVTGFPIKVTRHRGVGFALSKYPLWGIWLYCMPNATSCLLKSVRTAVCFVHFCIRICVCVCVFGYACNV